MIEIRRINNEEEMNIAYQIRREVFIEEQGVPEELEMDELDKEAIHVLAYVDGAPAGCGRMLLNGTEAKIGRIAVRKSMRGTGIGTGMCKLLIAIAEESGIRAVYVNAQLTAEGFYTRLGFNREAGGNTFLEAGIEHVRMVRSLW
jgi:predicted GNAT family N-acyltransferase